MSRTPEDIDQLLRDSGTRWRASFRFNRASLWRPDVAAGKDAPHRLSPVVATGVGSVALIALVYMAVQFGTAPGIGSGQPHTSMNTTSPEDTIVPATAQASTNARLRVNAGDSVYAEGRLLYQEGQPTALCRMVLAAGERRVCLGRAVGVDGLSPQAIPGYPGSAEWTSPYLRLIGDWDGQAIVDARFDRLIPEPNLVHRPMPCAPPTGGWLTDVDDVAQQQATEAILSRVAEEPDRFVGPWLAQADGVSVMVVGAVSSTAEAQAELSVVYPFNLCVTPVEFSSAELDRVKTQIAAAHPDWDLRIDPMADRVIVTLAAVDTSVLSAASEFGEVVSFNPLVRPVGQ
jgi:hypothetical protein